MTNKALFIVIIVLLLGVFTILVTQASPTVFDGGASYAGAESPSNVFEAAAETTAASPRPGIINAAN